MKTENVNLMKMARESLEGKWGLAVITYLVFGLLTGFPSGFNRIAGFSFSIIIIGALSVGMAIFSLSISRGKEAKFKQLFEGFNIFLKALATAVLKTLFILLWTILLIVPGIIAAISYSMTYFILAEDSSIGAMDALKKSKEMMYGYKWKYFCLCWRFFGWALLCIPTLGLGFLLLVPYFQISMAKFYDDIKEQQPEATPAV